MLAMSGNDSLGKKIYAMMYNMNKTCLGSEGKTRGGTKGGAKGGANSSPACWSNLKA